MATLLNNTQQKAFTTLARAKAFLGISGDSKDTVLTMLINQITGTIESYCGRRFLRQTFTDEEYDGTGREELVLKQYPVTSITRLQVNTAGDNSDSWDTINSSDYFWYEEGRLRLNNSQDRFLDRDAGYFLDHPQKYRVTYVAGYLIDFDQENTPASHTLPQEIEYVTLKLLSAYMNTRQSEGLSSAKVGDVAMSFKGEIMKDDEVKEILGKYASISI